ncbi:UNVERIFIED_CONTAM: hypothetical protein RMT77_003176 [Armadillidium vulgare]
MTPLVTSTQLSPSPTAAPIASLASTISSASGPITHAQLAAMYSPAAYADQPSPYALPALGGEQSAFYSPAAAGLDLKESIAGSPMAPTWPYPSMYYPYDTALATYPFSAGYGMGLDAARRKNATREATTTLKAWLNEHKKNPYPTKGEKIMLAIITKMTLTQVSTWFANARRRLKKENKMTWEPRSKTDEDDDDDDDRDDDKIDDKECRDDDKKDDRDSVYSDNEKDRKSSETRPPSGGGSLDNSASGNVSTDVVNPKPRIWSIADMATSGSLSGSGTTGSLGSSVGGKIISGGLTRGLHHLEGSPYARPFFAPPTYPYITGGVPESLLSYPYAKSFPGFPPVSLSDMSAGFLATSPFVHELTRQDLPRPEISKPEVIRPEPRQLLDKNIS